MRLLVCGLLSLLPTISFAQTALDAENVLVPIPPDFSLGFEATSAPTATSLQEWVPNGESVENWSEMVSIRIMRQLDGADPTAFHQQMAAEMGAYCPDGVAEPVRAGVELGTPFDLMLATCPNSPVTGGPESLLSKAMGGQDALYLVQAAWAGELTEEALVEWSQFMAQVFVCDTRRPEAPCPQ